MDQQGQEMFLNFILQRVQEGKENEAKEILIENFKKQQEGTFTQDDIQQFIPKMISLIKPDKLEEIKAVVKQFSGSFGQLISYKRTEIVLFNTMGSLIFLYFFIMMVVHPIYPLFHIILSKKFTFSMKFKFIIQVKLV